MTSKSKGDGSIRSKEERRKRKEKRKKERDVKKDKKRKRKEMDDVHGFEPDDHGSGHEQRRTDKHEKEKGAEKGVFGRKEGMVERTRSNVGDHDLAQRCKPVNKVFYQEHPDVSSLTHSEVQEYRDQLQISVENLPQGIDARPVRSFHQAGFPSALDVITSNFRQPSPIQSQAWPLIMAGHDLVGIAATGSGKTLAFGLPAITHILGQPGKSNGQPRCLILAPTRELCQQIGDVMDEACKACGLSCCVVYGGVPKNQQIKELRAGVDVVAATPGRLEDLMESGHCSLQGISFLVLDEADRMLDLGFLPHIRSIVTNIRSDRQTVMFSATWPQEVQSLAIDFMCKPAKCTIGAAGLSAASSVSQVVEVMDPKEKDARLDAVLRKYHTSRKNRVLIFVLYKKEAERVEQLLQRRGWECTGVHGDKSQADRTRAVQRFKEGKCPLLIATDVAARGLDIPDVEYVINYTFPLTSEDYVHRIGRTGRAGKTGCSHTFFTFHDKARAGELQNLLRKAGQPVPQELLSFGSTVKKKESKLYGAHFKEVDMMARPTKITFDD